ncbi:hypothetical protein ACFYR1_51610 [Streptomyces canus]|uniref:hypothetical protein n=1 Tax=Streptomyces canus TaxID=58343 RepID=UPI0036B20B9C
MERTTWPYAVTAIIVLAVQIGWGAKDTVSRTATLLVLIGVVVSARTSFAGSSSRRPRRPTAICLLKYEGPDLTYKQIGERLGGMTSRAVEGQLQRLRGTAYQLAHEGKIEHAGVRRAGQ